MSSIDLETGGCADQIPVHFTENDPDFVEFFRVLSIAMMRQTTKNEDVTDEESNILYGCLQRMIGHIKKHKKAKKLIPDSKRRRHIVMMQSAMDFRELVKSGALPPPAFPWTEYGNSIEDEEHKEEGGEVKAHAEASAEAGAEADTKPLWPSEISETWQFYCACKNCKYPNSRVTLRIGVVLDSGKFLMPVKVYANSDDWWGGPDALLMRATLTNQHHEAVATSTTNLSAFSPEMMDDPSYKFALVPHRLGMCILSPKEKEFYQDHNNNRHWNTPFKQLDYQQPLVRDWPEENERWTINKYMATQNLRHQGIRLEERERIGFVRGIIGVAAFAWSTRH